MKKYLHIVSLLCVALAMASCTEKAPQVVDPQDHLNYGMVNTTWEGTYQSPIEAPDGSTITFQLSWTMDFLTDTSGSLLCEITSALSQPQYKDIGFTYSVDGSTGHFYANGQEDTFAIDWSNNRITMDLQMPIDIGAGRTLIGGVTDLYRIR